MTWRWRSSSARRGARNALERVAREAQVTGRLGDHPNVVTIFDTGASAGIPYLVLRVMPGGSLAELIRRGRVEPSGPCGWAATSRRRSPMPTRTASSIAT